MEGCEEAGAGKSQDFVPEEHILHGDPALPQPLIDRRLQHQQQQQDLAAQQDFFAQQNFFQGQYAAAPAIANLDPSQLQQYFAWQRQNVAYPHQPQQQIHQELENNPSPSSKEGFSRLGFQGGVAVDLSKHPSGIVPTLQNIVATVNMDCKLELKTIALHARNAEYNPKRFAAVIMRIREPKTTALIFASGKMVCTGAKSEQNCRLAARKYARIIQKLGFPSQFKDFKIQNIVGSCDVRFPIRLEGLAFSHGHFSTYEPEIFPGLIYRMKQPKIVLLIFVSGKIVLTGAKVRDEIYEAFENIYPVLAEFRKIPQ